MKHFFALPSLLRPALYLAAASQHSFSVADDLLAFPQYEVSFLDDTLSESDVASRLQRNTELRNQLQHEAQHDRNGPPPPSGLEQYRPAAAHDTHEHGTVGGKTAQQRIEYERMLLGSHRYLCTIPIVSKPVHSNHNQTAADTASTKAEEKRELERATDRGWELLQGMQGNCVYFISGWWSYRFCYGESVKQFHQLPPSRGVPVFPPAEDPGVQGFELGVYRKGEGEDADKEPATDTIGAADDIETSKPTSADAPARALDVQTTAASRKRSPGRGEIVQRGDAPYLVQQLAGGTPYDLTGKDRRIEVQFHCNPQSTDRISLIKETATCAYLMVIQTPRLCNDVAFLPPRKEEPNRIGCRRILRDGENSEEVAVVEGEESELLDAQRETRAQQQSPPVMVGDIPLGAHRLIPSNHKLERSAIGGGGQKNGQNGAAAAVEQDTYVDTIASSDGRVHTDDELRRLGLGDKKAMEKLKRELEKIAKGQEWRLDVVDTPQGREYRGIIGDDGSAGGDGEAEEEREESEEGQGSKEEFFKEEL